MIDSVKWVGGIALVISLIAGNPAIGEKAPYLSLSLENNRLHFSWGADFAVDHYRFFYAPFPSMEPVKSVDMGSTEEFSITLFPPAAYYVAVGAYDAGGILHLSPIKYFRLRDIWVPSPGTSWQWQLTQPVDTHVDVAMFDIDLFETPESTIEELHAEGKVVICYFSAGSYEKWRPDASFYPDEVIGKPLEGWPDEKWLDIRRLDLLAPLIEARLDLAVSKGCDGVEPDNVDGYANDTGFPLSHEDQLHFNRWLAMQAHIRGLSVGLKNDLDQVEDLEPYFDWALNEKCFTYDECDKLLPFIQAGKAVFGVEYDMEPDEFCSKANAMGFDFLKKDYDLDAWRVPCRNNY